MQGYKVTTIGEMKISLGGTGEAGTHSSAKAVMMDRKQIEQWAVSSGLDLSPGWVLSGPARDNLERFAALVAAHEREQCALVCDAMGNPWRGSEDCAAAIRARG